MYLVIRPIEIIQLVGHILEKYKQAASYQIYNQSESITEDSEKLDKEIQADKFELMCLLGIGKRPPKGEQISIKLINKD